LNSCIPKLKSFDDVITYWFTRSTDRQLAEIFNKKIQHSVMKEIKKNYPMKQFGEEILFSKEGCSDGAIQSGTLLVVVEKLR
jgi:hypothetical protein